MTRTETIIMLARRLDRSYREIAETVGISTQAAHQAVQRHAPELARARARRSRKKKPTGRCAHCRTPIPAGRKYCSRACAAAARRVSGTLREKAYMMRLETKMTWREIAEALAMADANYALKQARIYAKSRGKPWPITRGISP